MYWHPAFQKHSKTCFWQTKKKRLQKNCHLILKEGASKGETQLDFPVVWLHPRNLTFKYHKWCISEKCISFQWWLCEGMIHFRGRIYVYCRYVYAYNFFLICPCDQCGLIGMPVPLSRRDRRRGSYNTAMFTAKTKQTEKKDLRLEDLQFFTRVSKMSQRVIAKFLFTIKNTSFFFPSFRETTIKLLLNEINRLPLDPFSIHCHDFGGRAKRCNKTTHKINSLHKNLLSELVVYHLQPTRSMWWFTLLSLLTKSSQNELEKNIHNHLGILLPT